MKKIFESLKSKIIKKDVLAQSIEQRINLLDRVETLKKSLPKKELSSNYNFEVLRVDDFEFSHRRLFTDKNTGKSYYEIPAPSDATTAEKVLNFNEKHLNKMVVLTSSFAGELLDNSMFYEFDAVKDINKEYLSDLIGITVIEIKDKETTENE